MDGLRTFNADCGGSNPLGGTTRASSTEEQHRPKVRVPSSNLGRGTASVAQRKSRGFLPHECAGSNPARGTCIMYQAEWGSSVVPASLISWSPVVQIHPPQLSPDSSAAEHRHDKPKAPGSMPGPDTSVQGSTCVSEIADNLIDAAMRSHQRPCPGLSWSRRLMVRSPGFQSGWCRFESGRLYAHLHSLVAQLAEQAAVNRKVESSNLSGGA